jgi:hypothetical protein
MSKSSINNIRNKFNQNQQNENVIKYDANEMGELNTDVIQNEMPELPEKRELITSENEYLFLNDSELSFLEPDEADFLDDTKEYNIYLCLYKINNELEKPFLEYYFIKDFSSGDYTFPKVVFDKTQNSLLEQISFFYKNFIMKIEVDGVIETFKGYIMNDVNIFAVYEFNDDDELSFENKEDLIGGKEHETETKQAEQQEQEVQ